MKRLNRCSSCGAELGSPVAPEEFCAKCLLGFALGEGTEGDAGAALHAEATPAVECPEQIGPYRILKKLGEGGMGEVYLAEQTEPSRHAALKLIKPGMDSKQVLARFESERQALALMDHPSIAKVFDGGTTDQGRPYFVMEYIEGEPITHYCDRHSLSIEDRLELFVRVCDAVQHAHHKGVIHRDIKPSNVLVGVQDQQPVPRIIDFGVAKATQHRLTERTVFTGLGELIGTPEYMSPEQAEMTTLDVDTRTDVYSLGVLLYELLVGITPFEPRQLRSVAFDEICRILREEDPPRPSTRAGSLGETTDAIAKNHSMEPRALMRTLRGDLDWITMKALEKDRSRRYGSPAELAADIERHLADEPVLAGPPAVTYRARKFVRRHRVGVGVASMALIVLIAFAATMTVQSERIANERDRANREAQRSSRVADFMTEVFNVTDPYRTKGEEVTAAQLLDRAAERIQTELTDEPGVQGSLMHTIGSAYHGIGAYVRAEEILREASRLQRSTLGETHPDTLKTDWLLATTFRRLNRLDAAEELLRGTLERQKTVLGDDHIDTLITWNDLGSIASRRGDYAGAAGIYKQVLSRARTTLGPEHSTTLGVMSNLAYMYTKLGRLDESESMEREVIEMQTRVLGEDHPSTLESMHVLGVNLRLQGRFDEAEQVLAEAVERLTRVFDEGNIFRIATAGDLAAVYFAQERYPEAEAGFRKNYESYRDALGEDHPRTVYALHRVALALARRGRLDEAERIELKVLEDHRRVAGDEHPKTLMMIQATADIYNEMGDPDRARPYMNELIETRGRLAASPDAAAVAKVSYARLLLECEPTDLRDPQTALRVAREAVELSEAPNVELLRLLALANHQSGDTRQAVEYQRQAIEALPEGRAEARATLDAQLERYEARIAGDDS